MDQKSRPSHPRFVGAIFACLVIGLMVTSFLISFRSDDPRATLKVESQSFQTFSPTGENLFQSVPRSHAAGPSRAASSATGSGPQTATTNTPTVRAELGQTATPTGTATWNAVGGDAGGVYYFPTDTASGGTPTATWYVIYFTPLPTWTTAPTATPSLTFTPKPTSTPRFSATPTRTRSSGTPIATLSPTITVTPTVIFTPTAQITSTPTPEPTDTPELSAIGVYAYLSRNSDGSGRRVNLVVLPDAVSSSVADIPDGEICAWSPDGINLLVQVPRQQSTVTDLAILALDGTLTPLTASLEGSSGCGDWLPDGSAILFPYTDESGVTTLSSLEPGQGELKKIFNNGSKLSDPDVSPDGRWVVFAAEIGSERSLELLDLIDGSAKRITFSNADEEAPRFSADHRRLLFSRFVESSWDLFSIDIDTLVETRLTNNPANERWPEETSDGQFILFSSDAPGSYSVFLLKMGEPIPLLVIPGEMDQTHPLWQP